MPLGFPAFYNPFTVFMPATSAPSGTPATRPATGAPTVLVENQDPNLVISSRANGPKTTELTISGVARGPVRSSNAFFDGGDESTPVAISVGLDEVSSTRDRNQRRITMWTRTGETSASFAERFEAELADQLPYKFKTETQALSGDAVVVKITRY